MIRLKTLALAAVVALSLPSFAFAAAPKAPAAAESAQPAGMPPYPMLHTAYVGMLTDLHDGLVDPDNQGRLDALPAELAKLPGLEKAYVDAKNAGKEADAKAALDSYTKTAQKVIDLALPLDSFFLPMQGKMEEALGEIGPVAAKLKKEKDVAALQADIDKLSAPLKAANEQVGPLQMRASATTAARLKLERAQIFSEELSNTVSNYLQGKIGK